MLSTGSGEQWVRPLVDERTLATALTAARASRGKRQRILSPRRPTRESFEIARGRSTAGTWHRAHAHLCRVAVRSLNDIALQGYLVPPDVETLANALDEYTCTHLRALLRYRAPGDAAPSRFEKWATIDEAAQERLVTHAARVILDGWSPAWIVDRRERGRRGGLRAAGGRPREWDDADLDQLELLRGLTVAEQAARMDVSRSTVDRMRAALRYRASAT